jgi:lipid-binding SYLF domain-containing protein
MRATHLKIFLISIILTLATPAFAATTEEKRVADAADVLDQLLRIPEKAIPPSLLARAYAVAVIPNVIKAGFIFGGRRGKGVIVVRQDNDTWSNPAFVTITGGSVGWQAGVASSDVILVFKTRKGVTDIADGKMTLGADASIAAGPVGRQASVATDIQFEAEVMSYSRSRGLFAGVALEGSGVTMDREANTAFYGSAEMTPDAIFASSASIAPDVANTFVQLLTAQTRRLPTTPGMQSGAAEPARDATETVDSPDETVDEVRTFGMPDPEK